MDREKTFIRSMLVYTMGTVIPRLSHFVLLPLYTAYLTTSEYGSFDLVSAYISIFVPLATLELQQATFRFLLDVSEEDDLKKKTIISSSIIAFISPTIIFAFVAYLPILKINRNLAIFLYLSFVLASILEMLRMITRGLKKNKSFSYNSILQAIFTIISMIVMLIILKTGISGALLANCIVYFVTIVFLLFDVKIYRYVDLKLFDIDVLKRLLKYSLPIIPTATASWILTLSDRWILSVSIGLSANGIYAAANKIPQIIGLGVTVFNLSWQESAAIASKDGDSDYYYSKMFKESLDAISSIAIIVVAFSPFLFKLLVNEEFIEAFPHMLILLLAYYYSCCSAFFDGIYIAKYETKKQSVGYLFAAVINLCVNLIYVKRIGIFAASVSTLVSYLTLYLIRCIDIRRRHNIAISFLHNSIYSLILIAFLVIAYFNQVYVNLVLCTLSISVFFIRYRERILFLLGKLKK